MRTFTVGQPLWFVPVHGAPSWRPIEVVGRRWLQMAGHCGYPCFIDKDTFTIKDTLGQLSGHFYLSPDACAQQTAQHAARQQARDAWDALRTAFYGRYRPPDGVTVAHIQEAMALLGLATKKETISGL